MTNDKIFLTAHWKNLIFVSYYVDPKLVHPILPIGIETDKINNKAVVTLVAFNFSDTKVKHIPLPIYGDFPEVNLRFNVKDSADRHGVVFIREIVPRSCIAYAANLTYNENYKVLDIKNFFSEYSNCFGFQYRISNRYTISAVTHDKAVTPVQNSIEERIKHRNSGYGIIDGKTIIYKVDHVSWQLYPVIEYSLSLDFGKLFGKEWKFLNDEIPFNVMVADGSNVKMHEWEPYIFKPKKIKY